MLWIEVGFSYWQEDENLSYNVSNHHLILHFLSPLYQMFILHNIILITFSQLNYFLCMELFYHHGFYMARLNAHLSYGQLLQGILYLLFILNMITLFIGLFRLVNRYGHRCLPILHLCLWHLLRLTEVYHTLG
jgi:hypothetical protein